MNVLKFVFQLIFVLTLVMLVKSFGVIVEDINGIHPPETLDGDALQDTIEEETKLLSL